MVELITIIVIMGVLAAIVVPRFFDSNVFESRGFHDQVMAALRYAQKAAIAQRGYVCVAFTANSATLTTGSSSACGTPLASPDGQSSPYKVSTSQTGFSVVPTNFNFNPLGQPSVSQSITISGYTAAPITVEQETGYVH